MTKENWQRIKSIQPPAGRYFHESCRAFMENVRDPVSGTAYEVPRIVRTGGTYIKTKGAFRG